jgi:hypothetical protein
MNTDIYAVTLDELKGLAAPIDKRKISRQWVSKYARLGLLPPHRPPGLGPGRGRQDLYSQALANQLVPLILALQRHGKNLDAVGWELWWHGHFAAPIYWRDRLLKAAAIWDRTRAAVSASEEREEETDRLIQETSEELRERKDAGRLIGAVKRHAPDALSSFLAIGFSVLNSSYVPFYVGAEPDEDGVDPNENLFSKTLSIPINAPDNSEAQNKFPTDVTALDQRLHNLSQIINVGIADFVSSQGESEIQLARNELALFMGAVSAIEQLNQEKSGQSLGAKPILWSNQTQDGQANMLIGWLFVRRDPTMQKAITELNAQIIEQIKSARGKANDA